MNKKWYVSIGLATWLVVLAGCRPPAPQPFVPTDAAITQVAGTIVAALTQTSVAAGINQPVRTTEPAATEAPSPTAVLAETSMPTPTDTPVPTATETQVPSPTFPPAEVLFEEDFEDETGWADEDHENFGFRFSDGGYLIYNNLRNAIIWSIRDLDYADIRLEVDAALVQGPQSAFAGLVCRHEDEDNFYVLAAGADGRFGIGLMQDGEFEFLAEGTDQAGVLRSGDQVNHLRGDCVGDRLTLYANGQFLIEVQDDTLRTGVVGMAAGTRLETLESVQVRFDNFMVLGPGG